MNPRIKHAIIDSGKSYGELAKYLGISQSHLSNLIADRRKLSLDCMKKIARFLNADLEWLLGLK